MIYEIVNKYNTSSHLVRLENISSNCLLTAPTAKLVQHLVVDTKLIVLPLWRSTLGLTLAALVLELVFTFSSSVF